LGHNALRGPGRDNWNIALFKNFVLSEARGSRIEFRVETFNTWNHTQWNAVSTSFNGYKAGTSTPTNNFGQVTSAFDPRIFQLGLKVYY
jgi:3D (Asp-Asp-Asp) domain-containing protein